MKCPVCSKEIPPMPSKVVTVLDKRFIQKAWVCTNDNVTVMQNVLTADQATDCLKGEVYGK